MTLEETLNAVREYCNRCSNRNSENHTFSGVEVDPHTLAWVEYWLTWMSEKLVFEAPIVDGWISVKDKLPEKPGHYLTASDAPAGFPKLINILMFVKDLHETDPYNFRGKHRPGWVNWDDEYGYYEYDAVTHWMPLPEPPEGE